MKNIALCLFAACVISCSGDNDNKPANASANYQLTDIQPANSDNPYDQVGQLFSELFDSYYDGSILPTTLSGISTRVEGIAALNSKFVTLAGTGYSPASVTRMDSIISHPTTCLQTVVNGLQLTSAAKLSLKNFTRDVTDVCAEEEDYDDIYTFITAYEDDVINSTTLTGHDKQVILSTTSICRYSAYKPKRKPKRNTDPEWFFLLIHVVGGSDGADQNVSQAITESLTIGIAGNE